jgi:hypothetical protein
MDREKFNQRAYIAIGIIGALFVVGGFLKASEWLMAMFAGLMQ